jgi:hypothetical protein
VALCLSHTNHLHYNADSDWSACAYRYITCISDYHSCTKARRERNASILVSDGVAAQDCEPLLSIQNHTRNLDQACHMTTVVSVQGMAIWRWLLFVGLFWPLELLAYFVARVFTALVHANLLGEHVRPASMPLLLRSLMRMPHNHHACVVLEPCEQSLNLLCGSGIVRRVVLHILKTLAGMQAVFLTFGLNRQLAYTLRAALWFGLWFAITSRPRSWARQAESWREAAGKSIWEPTFLRVHSIVWRLLLVYLLYKMAGLLSSAAGKALSLQFHHKNHFARMQVCFVNMHGLLFASVHSVLPGLRCMEGGTRFTMRQLSLLWIGASHMLTSLAASTCYGNRMCDHLSSWDVKVAACFTPSLHPLCENLCCHIRMLCSMLLFMSISSKCSLNLTMFKNSPQSLSRRSPWSSPATAALTGLPCALSFVWPITTAAC